MATAKTFRDIKAWQIAYRLVLGVYQLTVKFPSHEVYGLTSQLRRASVSVILNIAEGFKRKSRPDSLRFYNLAEASLEEVKCALLLAKDLNYCSAIDYEAISDVADESGRLLYGVDHQSTRSAARCLALSTVHIALSFQ